MDHIRRTLLTSPLYGTHTHTHTQTHTHKHTQKRTHSGFLTPRYSLALLAFCGRVDSSALEACAPCLLSRFAPFGASSATSCCLLRAKVCLPAATPPLLVAAPFLATPDACCPPFFPLAGVAGGASAPLALAARLWPRFSPAPPLRAAAAAGRGATAAVAGACLWMAA